MNPDGWCWITQALWRTCFISRKESFITWNGFGLTPKGLEFPRPKAIFNYLGPDPARGQAHVFSR